VQSERGDSKLFIANTIGVNISTIIRELGRNCGKRGYRFKQANRKAILRRRKASTRKSKMTLKAQLYTA